MVVVCLFLGGEGRRRAFCPLKHKKRASCLAPQWVKLPLSPFLTLHINSVCLDPFFYRSAILCKRTPFLVLCRHSTWSDLKGGGRIGFFLYPLPQPHSLGTCTAAAILWCAHRPRQAQPPWGNRVGGGLKGFLQTRSYTTIYLPPPPPPQPPPKAHYHSSAESLRIRGA